MNFRDVIVAFYQAGRNLDFDVSSPFIFSSPDGRVHHFPLYVKDFGSPQGTLFFSLDENRDLKEIQQYGFFISLISTNYGTYEKQKFIDMLNDLGYYGPKETKPIWYTGEPWTE